MQKIHILPDETINKIAAGEVIERPASVVKELVENSIDANAKYINIEIEEAGKKLIRVSDNGCGMSPEDVSLSVQRYATSKIYNFSDFGKLKTLGFRGEALPSIVSVSKTKITSKSNESETSWEIILEGGKIISSTPTARSPGTTVEVKELFFNTPARKKFLKSNSTEQAHIIRIIEELAIAHYQIGFSLSTDNRSLLLTPPVTTLDERIADILGNKIYGNLIGISSEYKHMKISGFVSNLDSSQPNKNLQYFFVNSRPVTNRLISQAIYDAFRDSLPIGRHPIGIILIEINPQYIDINVHPTKRLVKFSAEQEVYNFINQTVRNHITKQKSPSLQFQEIKISSPTDQAILFGSKPEVKPIVSFSQVAEPVEISSKQKTFEFTEFHVLGQLHDTYVLVSSQEGLTIIDQHAAQERVLYETFCRETKNLDTLSAQELLVPFTIELAPHEIEILRNHLDKLNQLKFTVIEFGSNTVAFKSIPAILGDVSYLQDFFKEFLQNLINEFSNKLNSVEPVEKIIKSACRAAVKAHQKLSIKEIENLIYELNKCNQPLCCPHGRPTMIHVSIKELEKKFRRT